MPREVDWQEGSEPGGDELSVFAEGMEARGGIEPPIKVLQTYALPLGYRAPGNQATSISNDSTQIGSIFQRFLAEFPFSALRKLGASDKMAALSIVGWAHRAAASESPLAELPDVLREWTKTNIEA